MGSKGIPHDEKLKSEAFLETLFSNNSHYVTIRSLHLNKNREMSRITQTKQGLSDIFLKFPLDDDGITCRPLKVNNEYLYQLTSGTLQQYRKIIGDKRHIYEGPSSMVKYILNLRNCGKSENSQCWQNLK